jgi:mono/diheme cytochrome c family protein
MRKSLLFAFMFPAVFLGAGFAWQGNMDSNHSKVTIPVARTSPIDGKRMFLNYCSPCHGSDGLGHGPVAPALKVQPIDLTRLSLNHGGKFPSDHVTAVLEYGVDIPSHGSAEMPMWGPILGKMDQSSLQQRAMRISNLRRYLEEIQMK